MSWDVNLTFVEGSSNKFWRARVDGTRLFVNFGRIGSDGQTQIKDFDSPERARRELESVAASKRKKGYEDLALHRGASEGREQGEIGAEAEAAEAEEEVDEEVEEAEKKPAPVRAAARSAPARGKAAPPPSGPPPQIADLALAGERQVDLRLICVGNLVRTVVVERYASPGAASEAFERLRKAMATEGYQPVAQRPDL